MGITLDKPDRSTDGLKEFPEAFLQRLFVAAEPGAVFSEPVTTGSFTVITASAVGAGGGFGSGRGTGPSARAHAAEPGTPAEGEGSGMGGGGGSNGRPIAAIVIGPDGVTVKPIFDSTKILLTGVTALSATLAMAIKVRAKAR